MIENVIVTGGSGFIGTRLILKLSKLGIKATVLDHHPPKDPGITFVSGAVESQNTWDELPKERYDAIFHLAAKTSVLNSVKVPHEVFLSNVVGSHMVLEYARQNQIPSVVFASTNAVVGDTEDIAITENSSMNPLTPYGATKAAAEMLASAYRNSYGIATSMIRLTNVYGPSMWAKDSLVPRIFRFVVGEQAFAVYGDGEQYRDFVYVDDVADAFIKLAADKISAVVSFGSGESVSVNQLVALARTVTKSEIEPGSQPAVPGEMRGVKISLDRANDLGLVSPVKIGEGLRLAWDDFLASRV